jgi:hypothetical protein
LCTHFSLAYPNLNFQVGHFNSTGKKYTGHDSIWLSNSIQQLEITLGERYNLDPTPLAWVNGNLYQKTEQTIGIVEIPRSVCDKLGIRIHNASLDGKQKQAYLAQMQNTQKPVLPVHTIAERKLFTQLMQTNMVFQSCKTKVSEEATRIWNRFAEEEPEVYYKLEEQLTSYLNGNYKDAMNVRQSCSQARNHTHELERQLWDPTRTDKIVNSTSGSLVPHRVSSGFITETLTSNTVGPSKSRIEQIAARNNVSSETARLTTVLSQQRVEAHQDHAQGVDNDRKGRSCSRCGFGPGSVGCPGAAKWYICKRPCKDCGKLKVADCVGRTSTKPAVPRCMTAEDARARGAAGMTDSAIKHLFPPPGQGAISFVKS